jgi:benzoyl-CoA reductase/2-hydroxyglutaryl-CoA dehydratase subunit BcrC/BadD/HgdB
VYYGVKEKLNMASFEVLMKNFSESSKRYARDLKSLKAEGKRIVAWYGSYVPIELIHASGASQYPLFDGGTPEPVEMALQYLQFTTNAQTRYQVGSFLMGLDPISPICDLIVVDTKESDPVRFGNILEFHGLPVMYLGVPQDSEQDIAFDYYKKKLLKFKEKLESITGSKIDDAKLKESIEKYNRIRELIGEIDSLRKRHPPPISGDEFIKVNHYALRNDPDTAIKFLEEIMDCLKSGSREAVPKDNIRILMVGRGVAFGDYIVTKMIEDSGGVIVKELFDEGIVHLEKVASDGEPLSKLAERYYRGRLPACPLTPSFRQRWGKFLEFLKDYDARGILYYQLSFDVIYDHEWPIFAKLAGDKNIPFAIIETAYNVSREATESIRTRIESFIKMCRR